MLGSTCNILFDGLKLDEEREVHKLDQILEKEQFWLCILCSKVIITYLNMIDNE